MGIGNAFRNKQRTILILIVITVVVYLVVDIAYQLMELTAEPPPAGEQLAEGTPNAEAVPEPLEAYNIIVERNLFRTTDRPIVTADSMDLDSLEATALQLDLNGTIAGEDGRGYAIIEERDKKRQQLYKVGDRVGGATIVKIMRNAVVLRLGDKDQVLKKREITSAGGERRSAAAAPSGSIPPPRPASRPPAAGGPPDLASLLTQARVTPHVTAGSTGKPDGVIITEIQSGSLFESAGLTNGDLIQEVNGRPVSNINDLVAMYRDLKPGATLSVKVSRGGREMTLNHTVQ